MMRSEAPLPTCAMLMILAQVAVDEAEAKSRCCASVASPRPPEGAPEPPAHLDGGHHLGEQLRYRQPGEADQLAVARSSRANIPEPCWSQRRSEVSMAALVCCSSRTDPPPIQRITSGSALMALVLAPAPDDKPVQSPG